MSDRYRRNPVSDRAGFIERRITLGLRLRDVTEHINSQMPFGKKITLGALSHWERGQRKPSAEHLAAWREAVREVI